MYILVRIFSLPTLSHWSLSVKYLLPLFKVDWVQHFVLKQILATLWVITLIQFLRSTNELQNRIQFFFRLLFSKTSPLNSDYIEIKIDKGLYRKRNKRKNIWISQTASVSTDPSIVSLNGSNKNANTQSMRCVRCPLSTFKLVYLVLTLSSALFTSYVCRVSILTTVLFCLSFVNRVSRNILLGYDLIALLEFRDYLASLLFCRQSLVYSYSCSWEHV